MKLILLIGLFPLVLSTKTGEKLSVISDEDKMHPRTSHREEITAERLFERSNDIVIIAGNDSLNDQLQEILKSALADRIISIFTRSSDFKDYYPAREVTYLVVSSITNIRDILKNFPLQRTAEIIMITEESRKWSRTFAERLRNLGFTKFSLVFAKFFGKSLTFKIVEKSWPDETPIAPNSDNLGEDESSTGPKDSSSPDCEARNQSLTYAIIFEGTQRLNTNLGAHILELFALKKNLVMREYKWENANESTWNNGVKGLMSGDLDFFWSMMFMPDEAFGRDDVVAVNWYRYESIVFVDVEKTFVPPMASFFAPFSGKVWLYSLPVSLLFVVFAIAIKILWKRRLIRERIAILDLWSINVGQTIPRLPLKSGLRFVIGMWLIRNLILNGAYTGLLGGSLISGAKNYRLKGLQDVYDSGRPICGTRRTLELLNGSDDPVVQGICDRFQVTPVAQLPEKISNESCVVTRRISALYKKKLGNREDNATKIYIIDDAVVITYPIFFFTHPWIEDFNRIVSIAHSTGIFKKLGLLFDQGFGIERAKKDISPRLYNEVLTMTHLQPAFTFLLIGNFVASMVFVMEIIISKWKSIMKNREEKFIDSVSSLAAV